MRIAVIFTGGTIGSSIKDNFIGVNNKMQYVLLKKYENDKEIVFETSSPYSILSENLSANELNILQNQIKEKLAQDFDGIIVTHGSDTLQYTSTAIEYAFGDCSIPIMFVSSDYPLDDKRSNGYHNLEAAVEFIRNRIGQGVFVSYRNDNEIATNIHIPSRLLQHNELNANIYSIDKVPFAVYNGNFTINNINRTSNNICHGPLTYTASPEILVIPNVPAQNYSYSLENVKTILFKPYHSATLDTANESLKTFCKKANDKQIPIFVLSPYSNTNYESTKIYEQLNITPIPYCTFISAYIKLWIANSLGYDVKEFINKPIANEYIQ